VKLGEPEKPVALADVNHWTRWRLAAAFALVAAGWLLLAWPWLSGSVTIPYDAKAHFQAQLQFLANALHSGQSPFWAPNVFAGSPQVADPQSLIFSPLLLLAALTPDPSFRALDAFVFGLLLAGGFAIVLLFRLRNWHPAGAVVAALAFAFGASAAWRIQHIGQIQSFAFFAMALSAMIAALQRRSFGFAALAGVLVGLMLVEPDQIDLLGLIALVLIALFEVPRMLRDGVTPGRIAAIAGAAALACLLVTIVPLTWTILFAEASNRPSVLFSEAARAALHPASLLTGLLGDLFSAGDARVQYWGPLGSDWSQRNLTLSQNMPQLYAGALTGLAVVVIGVSRGLLASPAIRGIVVALAVSVLYGLGAHTPLFGLLFDWLPGVSAFRRPADATFLIGGISAIVAGYVVHRFASGTVPKAGTRRLLGETAAVGALIGIGAWLALDAGKLSVAARPLMMAALWLALAAGALLLIRRLGPASPIVAASVASVLMVADLSANNGPNQSTALPPLAYDVLDPHCKNETIALIKRLTRRGSETARRDRVELAGVGFDWPNLGLIHGFDHTLGYNPLRLAEFNEASGARDTIAGPDQKQFSALYPSYRSTFANLLGLRYIAMPVPIHQVDRKLEPGAFPLIARTRDAYVYENPDALPRAMFVAGWKTVDFETVLKEGFPDQFDPKETVLLETQIEEGEGPSAAESEAKARVGMSLYSNTEIRIEVEADRAGFVVLNDVWHPWWTASVDGEEVDILKANVVFRAVQVPAGKHVVTFSFRPLGGAIAELREKLNPQDAEEKDEAKDEITDNSSAMAARPTQ
jgi:hypothetical protein